MNVLKELHAVAGQQAGGGENSTNDDNSSKKFQLHCPVASTLPRTSSSRGAGGAGEINFTQAMEGYSLAAIMARLASEIEDNEDHSDSANTEEETKITEVVKEKEAEVQMPADAAAAAAATEPAKEVSSARRPPGPRLSVSFKTGTAVSHQAAEDVHFVSNFIRGEIDRTIYAELVIQLYHVYEKLEACLLPENGGGDADNNKTAKNTHPAVEQFRGFHQQLQRTETLREDLDFWHGPVETEKIVADGALISPAARDYTDRLEYCAAHDPLLLLAHSYTRYLGDLSGGKILARVARRAMNLDKSGDGLAFYDFDQTIPSAKKFKDEFRTALDALDLTEDEIQRLVAEANVAFLLNMRLFEELDVRANVPGAKVRPLAEALAYQNMSTTAKSSSSSSSSSSNAAVASGECPFAVGSSSKPQQQAAATKKEIPAECPFSKMDVGTSKTATAAPVATVANTKGRCPWPFIIAHDPVAALQDWQTWALIGLLLAWGYSKL